MFTGGCHYSGNCENFKNICEKCPQVRSGFRWLVVRDQIQKTKMYSKFGRIVTMSPSSWLAKLAQESTALKNTAIEVIQNPIPEEFIRHLKLEKKSSYVVGFVSANLDNPYKGVDVLVKAMNLLSSKKSIPPFRLVAIGKGSLKGLSNNVVVEYFQTKNNFEMIPLLDGIDLLVVPSNQDNSPSVIGEALLHGIPVLGSDVGGIPELLGRFNCQTFKSGSHVDLANEIEKHFDGEVKQLPSQAIIEFFSERTYAKRFKEIIDLHSQ
jgi:glycosyltransferase involved in cell wall biosynthesis